MTDEQELKLRKALSNSTTERLISRAKKLLKNNLRPMCSHNVSNTEYRRDKRIIERLINTKELKDLM